MSASRFDSLNILLLLERRADAALSRATGYQSTRLTITKKLMCTTAHVVGCKYKFSIMLEYGHTTCATKSWDMNTTGAQILSLVSVKMKMLYTIKHQTAPIPKLWIYEWLYSIFPGWELVVLIYQGAWRYEHVISAAKVGILVTKNKLWP